MMPHQVHAPMQAVLFLVLPMLFVACSTTPKLDSRKIRPWSNALTKESPNQKAVIAHYSKDGFELFYLAARHTNTLGEDTLNLVQTLFDKYRFDVLIIESIPHSSGKSPIWFVDEAKKGRSATFVKGGESALAAVLADEKKILFYGGEPDHRDIYNQLKSKGYSDRDIISFYTIRQVPQWVREHENKQDLLQRKTPKFAGHYCKLFSISSCPTYADIVTWYKDKLGHELLPDMSNEEIAPYSDGSLFTQEMSSDVGYVRDRFTLSVIEKMLQRHRRVAVVYGAGHFITLRKSFDASFGEPKFIEDYR